MAKGWKAQTPVTLKKLVYALSEHKLGQNIKKHEQRGWKRASEIKEHGYGVAVLMEFPPRKEVS
ncbi:hypothetical protein [Bacillus sp. REN10]|uniref:hypothetical protein n=1 Tax=Bacillus sp. REN10 TaxID=2782541 RepID=UPI00193BD5EA|nr:hypothetical protein [Bacillus sp. REN10]